MTGGTDMFGTKIRGRPANEYVLKGLLDLIQRPCSGSLSGAVTALF